MTSLRPHPAGLLLETDARLHHLPVLLADLPPLQFVEGDPPQAGEVFRRVNDRWLLTFGRAGERSSLS